VIRQSSEPVFPAFARWYTGPVKRIERRDFEYQPYFCEENVWRLLARPEFANSMRWAAIVSNEAREIVTLRQRAGRLGDGLVHWDYHVFGIVADPVRGRIALDLDSDLPFPCQLLRYIHDSFPSGIQKGFLPSFRVMAGEEYVASLVSDRSHMRKPGGGWIAPPPPWPAPGEGRENVLMAWADMTRKAPGTVYDLVRMASFARAEA